MAKCIKYNTYKELIKSLPKSNIEKVLVVDSTGSEGNPSTLYDFNRFSSSIETSFRLIQAYKNGELKKYKIIAINTKPGSNLLKSYEKLAKRLDIEIRIS